MITDKTIEQLQEAVDTKTILIDGVTYATRAVYDVRAKEPVAEPLKIHTLSGLVEYVNGREKLDTEPVVQERFIHVVNHAEARLNSVLFGRFRQRENLVISAFEALIGQSFQFGRFWEAESFIIALQTLFVADEAQQNLLRFLGSIKEEAVKTNADDGVSQTVTARQGIARVAEIMVPNPVVLRPFRTFREIEQPVSEFILRMQTAKESSGKPLGALFEADGGKWKLEAIQLIKDYLEDNITSDITIIA